MQKCRKCILKLSMHKISSRLYIEENFDLAENWVGFK